MKRSLSDLTQLELTNQVFSPTTENPLANLGPAGLSIQANVEQYLTNRDTRVVGDRLVRAPSPFSKDTVQSVARTIRRSGGKHKTKKWKKNKHP